MNILANLSIRIKILLILLLPITGLVLFSFILVTEKARVVNEIEQIEPLVQLAVKASALVHETQRERGMTAGFLGSKGIKFANELPAQRKRTDERRAALDLFLSEFDKQNYSDEFISDLDSVLKKLEEIEAKRKSISSLKISIGDAIGYYSGVNHHFLSLVEQISGMTHNGDIAQKLNTYANFLEGKERAGIERAVLTNTFARDDFAAGMYRKFSNLVAEQKTYTNVFLSLADKNAKAFYRKTMNDPLVAEVERMRKAAFTANAKLRLINQLQSQMGYGGMIHMFKNYILRGSQKYVDGFNSRYQAVNEILDRYISLDGVSESAKKDISSIRAIAEKYRQELQAAAAMQKQGLSPAQIDGRIKINDKPALHAIKNLGKGNFGVDPVYWFKTQSGKIDLLKKVEDWLSDDLLKYTDELHTASVTTQIFYLVISVLIGLVAIIMAVFIARNITSSLNKALEALTDIAEGEGDLTRRLDIVGKDEIAKLANAFNKFAGKIEALIREVKQAVATIYTSSNEIAAGNANLSQRTEEQASSLEETASSMEEMTSTVKQNADNSRQANQLAAGAREQAEEGGKVVTDAVAAVSEINVASKKIADIIGVIDEIAFQTNLLALNAAVEAARAGEQGRGFAVVAGEVRTLAGRSAEAAKQIKGLITDSVEKVEQGAELVDASGQTLQKIVTSVKKVTDIMSEIAAASQEQASGIDEVNKAVMQMDEMTQQNAALVEEAASASMSMQEQAKNLASLVGQFKISDDVKLTETKKSVTPPRKQAAATPPPAAEPVSKPASSSAPKKVTQAGNDLDDSEWEEF